MADKTPKHRLEVVMGAAALPVRGDQGRLAQVFANLLENAVKYSPDGGVVEVLGEAAAGVVHVEVRDEGIGVPEEHQSRIFTKFFRADARESGIAGTGLGLAISREIIEAHAGRMGFTSTDGVGSRFWFELPLAVEREPVAGGDGKVRRPSGLPTARGGLLFLHVDVAVRAIVPGHRAGLHAGVRGGELTVHARAPR